MAAVSRPLPKHGPLLSAADARRETEELLVEFTEDFQHDRLYGTVRVINPFA